MEGAGARSYSSPSGRYREYDKIRALGSQFALSWSIHVTHQASMQFSAIRFIFNRFPNANI